MDREYQIMCISKTDGKDSISDISYKLFMTSAISILRNIIFKERGDNKVMIAVLCNSYKNACRAFRAFVDILESNEPWSIKEKNDCLNFVEVENYQSVIEKYIFIDYRVSKVFEKFNPDVINLSEFFIMNGINYCEEVMDFYE